ncbi:hypothetical protein BJ165DRAFT_1597953 [Panaeolus papilionaceus]|nr:hypothetical protein BJ165DRAFT_1597953 [Panaeolus papilionaceus]
MNTLECKYLLKLVLGPSGVIDLVSNGNLLETVGYQYSSLTHPEAQTNADLRAILEKNRRENHETLTKFIAQVSIEAMQHAPPPAFLQPPAITSNESAAVVATTASSDLHETILQGDNAIPATASRLAEEAPPPTTSTLH